MMVRLQKVIAASGVASRRAAETMIRNGLVTVNGKVVRVLGTCIDPETDHVKVNGRHVGQAEPEAFVLLHKPMGYVTTMSDPHGRPTVADLLGKVKVRVFPVGRLDYDAEGLLLLTNNGMVAQACLHPRYHVPKTYVVKVSGLCTDEEIQRLRDGVVLDDGATSPAMVKKSGKAKVNSWLELTIHEGRKHQVKRMIEALGHRVVRIKRTRFGPLVLGELSLGACRFATDAEANALRAIPQHAAGARNVRAPVPPRPDAHGRRPDGETARPGRVRKTALPARGTTNGRGRRTPAVKTRGAAKRPVGGRPTAKRPVGGRPTAKRPVGGRPTAKRPVGGRPTAKRPVGGRPTAKRPVGGRPTAKRPVGGRPTAKRPAGGRSRPRKRRDAP